MNELDKEIAELKTFIVDLKEDRATQKKKEKSESWTKYTSMSMVFIAVLAAIATQWAGKYSSRTLLEMNKATLNQAQASDQWNFYQASSIKGNMYQSLLKLLPKDDATSDAERARSRKDFDEKVAKYEKNKTDADAAAKRLERLRDECRDRANASSSHGSEMGMSVAVFQIAIAMGSICLVTKKKWLWYISLILAAIATGEMLLVWLF